MISSSSRISFTYIIHNWEMTRCFYLICKITPLNNSWTCLQVVQRHPVTVNDVIFREVHTLWDTWPNVRCRKCMYFGWQVSAQQMSRMFNLSLMTLPVPFTTKENHRGKGNKPCDWSFRRLGQYFPLHALAWIQLRDSVNFATKFWSWNILQIFWAR